MECNAIGSIATQRQDLLLYCQAIRGQTRSPLQQQLSNSRRTAVGFSIYIQCTGNAPSTVALSLELVCTNLAGTSDFDTDPCESGIALKQGCF